MSEYLPAFAALLRLTAMTLISGVGNLMNGSIFFRKFTRVRAGND
jgi:hypothetical protein